MTTSEVEKVIISAQVSEMTRGELLERARLADRSLPELRRAIRVWLERDHEDGSEESR